MHKLSSFSILVVRCTSSRPRKKRARQTRQFFQQIFPPTFPLPPQNNLAGRKNSLAVFLGSIDDKIEPSNAGQPAIFPHHIIAITLAGTIESAPLRPAPARNRKGRSTIVRKPLKIALRLSRDFRPPGRKLFLLFLDWISAVVWVCMCVYVCVWGGRRGEEVWEASMVDLLILRVRLGLHLENDCL